MDEKKLNPAHYCQNCDRFIGRRGFCSQECHDNFYEQLYSDIYSTYR